MFQSTHQLQGSSPAKADQLVAAEIPYPLQAISFRPRRPKVDDREQGTMSSLDPLQDITPGYHSPPPLPDLHGQMWWGSSLGSLGCCTGANSRRAHMSMFPPPRPRGPPHTRSLVSRLGKVCPARQVAKGVKRRKRSICPDSVSKISNTLAHSHPSQSGQISEVGQMAAKI
jgi:hypothetical protein